MDSFAIDIGTVSEYVLRHDSFASMRTAVSVCQSCPLAVNSVY